MTTVDSGKELLPHLFRQEYSKMTAVLCRHFGLRHIEIAEDIASDTFLKAAEIWPVSGLPANPTAWLYTVARNRAKDFLKHMAVTGTRAKEAVEPAEMTVPEDIYFSGQNISDSQLAMIFAVCNPANSAETQISLALQILCGFSVEEIAIAFLSKTETIKKRLQRGRDRLRSENFRIRQLGENDILSRLDTVLKTLYLIFNEGYFSRTNDQVIRKDLCLEAVRLTLLLAESTLTNLPEVNALLALMCFQSSRLDARVGPEGEIIFFDEQDRNRWDKTLITKGNHYLVKASAGREFSKYHLEAAIAYWHTNDRNEKWPKILALFNRLLLVEYSPMAALNRTFAFAKVHGHDQAIPEAEKLNLTGNPYFYSLLGYLYSEKDVVKATSCYKKALALATTSLEKKAIEKRIETIANKRGSAG